MYLSAIGFLTKFETFAVKNHVRPIFDCMRFGIEMRKTSTGFPVDEV